MLHSKLGLSLSVSLTLALGLGLAACETDDGPACDGLPGTICTFAGVGTSGLSPDGLRATETEFYLPQDMTVGPDGHLYVLDWNNHRVRVIRNGIVDTIIGTGSLGDAPDGPALDTSLNHPTHVAFSPAGELILSAWHNSKVLRYSFGTDMIEGICGTGARNFNGDGLDGLETDLDLPVATAFTPDGRMFISDQANQRIRVLEVDGTVTTAVGTGEPGYSGDGGPAIDAQLHLPVSQSAPPAGRIATAADGTLYIADTLNHVIRKVDTSGIITTIAGTGSLGLGPAEGSATSVALHTPSDVAVDQDGNVYIADTFNSCVRKVSPDGMISTAAGICGKLGYSGDNGPADQAMLDRPYGVEVDVDGTLYVADTHNHAIRIIYPAK
jgi:hypothetical protein